MSSENLKFAIVTCSDTRGIKEDTAGAALEALIAENGWECASHVVVRDERPDIAAAIVAAWAIASSRVTDPSRRPRVAAKPLLVVARAWNPSQASSRADPWSQGLGSSRGRPGWCTAASSPPCSTTCWRAPPAAQATAGSPAG